MTAASLSFPKALAVSFSDLERWDVSSFQQISWHWPRDLMVPIGTVLRPRKEKVDRNAVRYSDLQPITIHFDGSIDKRLVAADREYSMDLWFARPGDIVVAKIDLKNGAVGITPDDWENVVVTGHFAAYEPDRKRLLPEYLHCIIQTSFFRAHLWRNKVGAEGRKEVKLDFFESQEIPLPELSVQAAIVAELRKAQEGLRQAQSDLLACTRELDITLNSLTNFRSLELPMLLLRWHDIAQWDAKSGRAAAFRLANPRFLPLSHYAEEATELVKPSEDPASEWAVYGVNNRDGVFFSHLQKGADFNTPYKRIRKNWFFHNPTRSSVGSLGIVPDVPENAITSPEYQVWRLRLGCEWDPQFVAALIRTRWFVRLIQFHRVGAVKQRLYVENLLEMPMPKLPSDVRSAAGRARRAALQRLAEAREALEEARVRIEALILGNEKIN